MLFGDYQKSPKGQRKKIEIPADDVERAIFFYMRLFDWDIELEEGRDCCMVMTDENKFLYGCMKERRQVPEAVVNYFGVKSPIEGYGSMVEKLGGKVIIPKISLPGAGYLLVCLDTENNVFRIFQEDASAR